jgi:hypothetical protein
MAAAVAVAATEDRISIQGSAPSEETVAAARVEGMNLKTMPIRHIEETTARTDLAAEAAVAGLIPGHPQTEVTAAAVL